MKRAFIIAGLICILHFSASGQSNGTIGLCLADLKNERWNKDRDLFIQSAQKMGYNIVVQCADNDQQRQIEQAEELIKNKVSVLIVVPVNAELSHVIVDKAHLSGIKVIAYDRMIMNCDVDAYISFDSELVGEFMAIYILNHYPGETYAYIGGPKEDNNAIEIRDGLHSALGHLIDAGKVTMVLDTSVGWYAENAYGVMTEFIKAGKKMPNAIFTGNDALATGTIMALEEHGLAGKVPVTGQDAQLNACRNIINGKQTLTLYKPIRKLVELTLRTTDNYIKGTAPNLPHRMFNGYKDVPSFIFNPVPVDIDNIKVTVIGTGYHTEAEIFNASR